MENVEKNPAVAGTCSVGFDSMWKEVINYRDVESVPYVETMYYTIYGDTEAIDSIIYDVDHSDEDALIVDRRLDAWGCVFTLTSFTVVDIDN